MGGATDWKFPEGQLILSELNNQEEKEEACFLYGGGTTVNLFLGNKSS